MTSIPATIAQVLAGARGLRRISESWRLDAELMLAEAIGRRREWLIAHTETTVDLAALKRYRVMLERRLDGEPMAYILGRKAFMDMDLAVSPAVLIPRPETELLVEWVLQTLGGTEKQPGAARQQRSPVDDLRLADLGTGSGAIALALAMARPHWHLHAVEFDAQALAVARANARTLQLGNVDFIQSSWGASLAKRSFDAIVANPPYVADGDPHLRSGGLEYEPVLALAAGEQGMDCLGEIVIQARELLKCGGWLFLEHGYDQGAALVSLLAGCGYEDVQGRKDYSGVDRMVAGRWVNREAER